MVWRRCTYSDYTFFLCKYQYVCVQGHIYAFCTYPSCIWPLKSTPFCTFSTAWNVLFFIFVEDGSLVWFLLSCRGRGGLGWFRKQIPGEAVWCSCGALLISFPYSLYAVVCRGLDAAAMLLKKNVPSMWSVDHLLFGPRKTSWSRALEVALESV